MRVLLALGGELRFPARVRRRLKKIDLVIAADKGAENAIRLGYQPHHVVGDFDSISPKTRHKLKAAQFHRYKLDKDYSDAELALRLLLRKKPNRVTVIGALGGRLDHTLANLSLLARIPLKVPTKIIDHELEIYLVRRRLKLSGKPGDLVSILPFQARGVRVTLKGFRYSMRNTILSPGAHGLSNEMKLSPATVSVKNGAVYVLHYR